MLKAVICGPIATQSGYGHHAREIADNLIKQTENEWDVKLLSMPWGGTPFTYPISVEETPETTSCFEERSTAPTAVST